VRTKVRQEFERHRYVQQLPVVDMLLFQSHAEFQVCPVLRSLGKGVDTLLDAGEKGLLEGEAEMLTPRASP
jgi:NADH dehydrogenase (ubiquinone) 1 alpha subcomplex subunit 6